MNSIVPDSSDILQNKVNKTVISKTSKITWQTFALAGWIAGMALFSLILIRKMSKFHKNHQIQEGGKTPEWFHELMLKTAQRLKLKKIPSIIFSKDVKSPAVYGVFRSVLLLPDGYLDQLSKEQAEHVLMHELCHLKRGDVLIHCFCIILQIIYWFNPFLIWARRQMRHVCEICCDLSVANILREKTTTYRNTLLNSVRELFTETMEPSLGLLGIFEEPFRLVPRLKWLEKKSWKNRKRKIATSICVSLCMVFCVMPMAGTSQPAAQNNNLAIWSDFEPANPNSQQIQDIGGVSRKMPIAGISIPEAQDNTHLVQSGFNPVESDPIPIIAEEEAREQKGQQGITDEVDEERKLETKKKELESIVLVTIPIVHADAKVLAPHIHLTNHGTLSIVDRTNTIIIKDIASSIAEAMEIVKQLDVPRKMIFLKIMVMEVDANREFNFGSHSYDLSSNAEQNSLIEIDKYEPLARRMESELNGEIISSPKILVVNGETAELGFGEVKGGELRMKITPQIIKDNNIQQEISLKVTRVDESVGNGQSKTSLKTSVIVREGHTIVIGGLQSSDIDKKSKDARELCIFITPSIFDQGESQAFFTTDVVDQASRHPTQKQITGYIADLKEELSLLESRYAPEHPDIIRLKEMIANLEAEE